ncbi:MAG TPA: hypothetical protein VM029_08235, partial [Opitutaceae bacterium]|nr:hypothetical protein [Opitutaceae bacterium]
MRSFFVFVLGFAALHGAETPAPVRPKQDANGNPIRYAATGHVSNYDESKVPSYTLPDPLVLKNGGAVRDAAMWNNQRRDEILELYRNEIYGRVPARTPTVKFTVEETDQGAMEGTAIQKKIVGRIGEGADAPKVNETLYLPAKAKGPAPVLLHLQFFGGARSAAPAPSTPSTTSTPPTKQRFTENGPITDML